MVQLIITTHEKILQQFSQAKSSPPSSGDGREGARSKGSRAELSTESALQSQAVSAGPDSSQGQDRGHWLVWPITVGDNQCR